jgi:hypothetical protein
LGGGGGGGKGWIDAFESKERASGQSVRSWVERPVRGWSWSWAGRSRNQPVSQSVGQSANESFNRSIKSNQFASQPASHPSLAFCLQPFRSSQQVSPLHVAIFVSRDRAALFLINDVPGVDLEARMRDGKTPLMIAARFGRVNVMKALVAKGVDVDVRNDLQAGSTALTYAIGEGKEQAALYLLEEANASWRVGDGTTAAGLAAMHGCCVVLKATLRRMADAGRWFG